MFSTARSRKFLNTTGLTIHMEITFSQVIFRYVSRVEDWRRCSVGPAYLLLPVSVGSASLSGP
jgi:hypothetical protein